MALESLQSLLENSPFRAVLARQAARDKLDSWLQSALPPALKGFCRALKLEDQALVIEMQSPLVRMALLQIEAELLETLRQADASAPMLRGGLTALRLQINPNFVEQR